MTKSYMDIGQGRDKILEQVSVESFGQNEYMGVSCIANC